MMQSMNGNNGHQQPQTQDLRSAVLEFEANLIRQALAATDNKPTAAARLLGLTSHQALLAMLDNRHRALRDELGLMKRPRRKSVMNEDFR
jgi:transcriptional regulator with PAS, ATPase and Fis domain